MEGDGTEEEGKVMQAETSTLEGTGTDGPASSLVGWGTCCVEEPRLGEVGLDWEGSQRPVWGLSFCSGHVCMMVCYVMALSLQEAGQPRWGLRDSGSSFLRPLRQGHSLLAAPLCQPCPQQPKLLSLCLLTAHQSSGSLGSIGAYSHPPDMVDSTVFDLHVPELYRQSPTYYQ